MRSPAPQDFQGQLAEALLRDGRLLAALGAADRPPGQQRREDHVLERLAVAEGVPGALLGHAVEHLRGRRLRLGGKPTQAMGAVQLDPHCSLLRTAWRWSVLAPDRSASGSRGTTRDGCCAERGSNGDTNHRCARTLFPNFSSKTMSGVS